jgi:glyoxylase-like metal-dependent hydrolase (beta-lactamase superfamily II)
MFRHNNYPKIYDLGRISESLTDLHLIIGEGLCSNIYVIGRKAVTLIDTGVGNNANPVLPQLEELGIAPRAITGVVLTHTHHDHAMGTFRILERASPTIYAHKRDLKYIATQIGPTLKKLDDGDVIESEKWSLKVIWTPGHTEGGICLYSEEEKILFSGDTVFPDGYFGRYDGESGSLNDITDSLRKLTALNVDIMLPGHGLPVFENAGEHIRRAYMNALALNPK